MSWDEVMSHHEVKKEIDNTNSREFLARNRHDARYLLLAILSIHT